MKLITKHFVSSFCELYIVTPTHKLKITKELLEAFIVNITLQDKSMNNSP